MTIGDLAQSLALRQDNLRIRADLERLSSELSSGKKADVTSAVSGDFGALSAIENSLVKLDSYEVAAKEARLMVQTSQQVLGQIQTSMAELSGALLLSQNGGPASLVDTAGADARARLESVISVLNTQVSDRSIFAGADTDGPSVAGADVIMGDLVTLAAAETTAAGVEAVIDTYFAPAGGYDTTGYLGDASQLSPAVLANGETISFPVSAASSEIRETLAAFAKGAILDEPALNLTFDERSLLARTSGEDLLTTEKGIVQLRADTGSREEQVDRAISRTSSERASLELAKSDLVSVDPFAVATQLQAAEAQLESLYTLTARFSRLSLTEFLR